MRSFAIVMKFKTWKEHGCDLEDKVLDLYNEVIDLSEEVLNLDELT
jgi:hypothetical protein